MLFGSTAIKHWFPDFSRAPKDTDIIGVNVSSKQVEYHYAEEFDYILKNNSNKEYVDPDFLYTIKVSHLAWNLKNNSWDKHMKDALFLKSKGCKLDYTLYTSLYNLWTKKHGKKSVKMDVQNSEFFKDNIYRKYNHEFLHEQFAFHQRPLNERIRKDLKSPLCSKELWDLLSDSDKLKCALEELYVLTTERHLLIDNPLPVSFAITKTLKHMITSTTSGWFNLYLILNFKELLNYDRTHFNLILSKL